MRISSPRILIAALSVAAIPSPLLAQDIEADPDDVDLETLAEMLEAAADADDDDFEREMDSTEPPDPETWRFKRYGPGLRRWYDRMIALVPEQGVNPAARALSDEFGLTEATMKELLDLWIAAVDEYYSRGLRRDMLEELLSSEGVEPGALTMRDLRNRTAGAGLTANFQEQVLDRLDSVAAQTKGDPLALSIYAAIVDELDRCEQGMLDRIVGPYSLALVDEWAVSTDLYCSDSWIDFAERHPKQAPAVALKMENWTSLPTDLKFAYNHWATLPEQQALISKELPNGFDGQNLREAFLSSVMAKRIAAQLALGDVENSIELMSDPLFQPERGNESYGSKMGFLLIGGLPVVENRPEQQDDHIDIITYLLGNREDALAVALLDEWVDMEKFRAHGACKAAGTIDCESPEIPGLVSLLDSFTILSIDYVTQREGSDPYYLMEERGSALTVELACRIFANTEFDHVCQETRVEEAGALQAEPRDWSGNSTRVIDFLTSAIPEIGELRAKYAARIEQRVQELGVGQEDIDEANSRYERKSIDPDPPAFALHDLPEEFHRSSRAIEAIPEGEEVEEEDYDYEAWEALLQEKLEILGDNFPTNFYPLRIEMNGPQFTVISSSSMLDPTGELGMGGYYVHLSRNGGATWETPLFTGLVENFPYVVVEDSAMPMRVGETLQVEVEIALLDTASITYPPVGLRLREERSDLFLEIPLADLRADRDHDGMTDLAERHLLFDREGTELMPFVVGSDLDTCTARNEEGELLLSVLDNLGSIESGAIIVPVRNPEEEFSYAMGEHGPATERSTRFIEGSPEQFRCLNPSQLTIVYTDEQLEAASRYRPDFRPIELPELIFNRDRTRAFVKWSAGWTGGTYVLRKDEEGNWRAWSTRQWIT